MHSVTHTGSVHRVAGLAQVNQSFTALLCQLCVCRLIGLEEHAEFQRCSAAARARTAAHTIITKTLQRVLPPNLGATVQRESSEPFADCAMSFLQDDFLQCH